MGTILRFRCASCGYHADVSGGPDRGVLAETRTMTCAACRDLVDVLVGLREGGEPDERLGRCPRCGGVELKRWKAPGPCPRCGGAVEPAPDGPVTLWD